jgi:hypothetical protein
MTVSRNSEYFALAHCNFIRFLCCHHCIISFCFNELCNTIPHFDDVFKTK